MQSKSLLIAVAAFAVTATGVHAYGGTKMLNRAGLTKDQAAAVEEAQALKESGNFLAARDKLAEAGITENVLRSMHQATKQTRSAIHEAIDNADYQAFEEAAADSPLADIITSESDFVSFVEAHRFKQKSERVAAKAHFDEFGLQRPKGQGYYHDPGQATVWQELTADQREALRVARQANDQATIQAILDEAGI